MTIINDPEFDAILKSATPMPGATPTEGGDWYSRYKQGLKAAQPPEDPNMVKVDSKNIVGGMVGSLLKPVVSFGKSIGESSQAPRNADLYAKSLEQHSQIENNLKTAIANNQKAGQDTTRLQTALQNHTASTPKLEDFTGDVINKTAKQVIGEGIGTGVAALSGGALSGAKEMIGSELAGKATLGQVMGQGAKIGAGFGGASSVAGALEQNKPLEDVAREGITGAGTGALLGAGTAGLVHGVANAPSIASDVTSKVKANLPIQQTADQKIADLISPKLTSKEIKLAQQEGRIAPGQEPTMFKSGTPDKVLTTDKVFKATQTIKNEIPDANKLKAPELYTALEARTTDMAKALSPEMKKVPIKPVTVQNITNDWTALKKIQTNNPYAPSDINLKKLQSDFETRLMKSKSGNMNDLWETRKAYDSSVPSNVKKATSMSSESLQAKKEIWLQNREVLNKAINDTQNGMGKASQDAFSKMTDMYSAKENLNAKASLELESQPSKVVQWMKEHPYISTAIGGTIIGSTGIPGKALDIVSGGAL